MATPASTANTAQEALSSLREGNQRFVEGRIKGQPTIARRTELIEGQAPRAIVLGCSDSRVPAELIFDQGLGDLFVIRIAGNIVAPSQVASVEFAVDLFDIPLVVVLGHTQCGAIQATIEQLLRKDDEQSRFQHAIVDRIRPAVADLLGTPLRNHPTQLLHQAGRANVRIAANQLRHGSAILEELIRDKRLTIVGAEYALETGIVDFFDGV